jgi:hypothetical protein
MLRQDPDADLVATRYYSQRKNSWPHNTGYSHIGPNRQHRLFDQVLASIVERQTTSASRIAGKRMCPIPGGRPGCASPSAPGIEICHHSRDGPVLVVLGDPSINVGLQLDGAVGLYCIAAARAAALKLSSLSSPRAYVSRRICAGADDRRILKATDAWTILLDSYWRISDNMKKATRTSAYNLSLGSLSATDPTSGTTFTGDVAPHLLQVQQRGALDACKGCKLPAQSHEVKSLLQKEPFSRVSPKR